MNRRSLILLAAVALLCFYPLSWSLWPDENFTAGVVCRDISSIIQSAAHDRHPPLYYLYAAALRWMGDGDTALRIPSGIAALAMVALTGFGISRREPRVAWIAMLLLGFSPVTILFAHTARMYALVSFFGALLLWGTLLLRDGRRLGLLALGLGAVGALYTHYASAGVVLAAFLSALWVTWDRRQFFVGVLGVGALALLLFAPWAYGPFQDQLLHKSDAAPRTWEGLLFLFWSPNPTVHAWNWLLLGLQMVGLGALWRRGERWTLVWVLVMLTFPLAVSNSEPAQNTRNYFGFFPFAAILFAEGVVALSRRLPPVSPILDYLPLMLQVWPLVSLLQQEVSPQDNGNGHDYRLEALVLDQVVPSDATLRFEPDYVQNHFARYAPALRNRTGPNGRWLARASGAKKEGCSFLGGFRVGLNVPEDQCEIVSAAMLAEAERSGYAPFWVEAGRRAMEARDLAAARHAAEQALLKPQRHFGAWDMLAEVALLQNQLDEALSDTDEALSVARGWGYNDKQIGGLWDQRAKILQKLGRAEEAEAATAAADCSRNRRPAWACGGMFSWLTLEGAEGPIASANPTAAAATPPKAGGGMDRGDWKDLEARSLPQRWEFTETDMPPGWVRTGYAEDLEGVLVVGDSKGPVDVACTPLIVISGPLVVRLNWQADILSLDPPTWAVIEVRASSADGRPLPATEATRFFSTRQAHPMMTETATWTPPDGTTLARVCIKTGGAANGSSKVDWLEVSAGS